MSDRSTKRESGFSLLEMVVAMALGTMVLGAAVQIYIQGVSATWTVSQRAEMQQDFRAASNMLTKDLSLAGAGLGNGAAIALPSATTPVYGCDQTSGRVTSTSTPAGDVSLAGRHAILSTVCSRDTTTGQRLSATQGATDVVTVVYTDTLLFELLHGDGHGGRAR